MSSIRGDFIPVAFAVVFDDEDALDSERLTVATTSKPDRVAIKEALKACCRPLRKRAGPAIAGGCCTPDPSATADGVRSLR